MGFQIEGIPWLGMVRLLKTTVRAFARLTPRTLVILSLLLVAPESLFTSFVGILLELLSTFNNCLRAVPVSAWLSPGRGIAIFT